jgi:hypothetical protein
MKLALQRELRQEVWANVLAEWLATDNGKRGKGLRQRHNSICVCDCNVVLTMAEYRYRMSDKKQSQESAVRLPTSQHAAPTNGGHRLLVVVMGFRATARRERGMGRLVGASSTVDRLSARRLGAQDWDDVPLDACKALLIEANKQAGGRLSLPSTDDINLLRFRLSVYSAFSTPSGADEKENAWVTLT